MQLPDLQNTNLDAAMVDAFFSDLARCARLHSIVPKTAPGFVAEQSISLEAAHAGWRDGRFRAVQIRYRFENREWCDTLMRGPNQQTRLVRICTDDALASTLPP